MKYILTSLILLIAFCTNAQPGGSMQPNKNPLLNPSFWQNQPDVEAIKAEVAKGSDPAELNPMSFDPVVLAINNNAPTASILYLLEQKGNDVSKLTHDGRTYIFWAASKGNMEVMQALVSKGAKVNIEDSHGYSVVNFAATSGQQNTAVYDLLLQHGASLKGVNHDGANALLLAISADKELKLTEYFQSKGLDIKSKDAAGNTAFNYAARSGNIAAMKKLFDKGVGYTDDAMLMAAQGTRRGSNTLEVYQYLESLGIKPTVTSKTGENVLHAIVRRPGQADIIKYFIGKGVNVNQANEEGNTVFMTAAGFAKEISTLELLKPLVKNINQANKTGATALAMAVRNNTPEVVEYLLSNDANLNTVDAKGNNLVYYLFESYTPRQVKDFDTKKTILQTKGLDLAASQKDGNTVYHLAVAKSDLALLKKVNEWGANVNAKSGEGLTALHKAAMLSKDNSLMQYLVSIGAKKDVKTSFNETAYDLAGENEVLSKQNVSIDFLK